jgi:hypothetical protein
MRKNLIISFAYLLAVIGIISAGYCSAGNFAHAADEPPVSTPLPTNIFGFNVGGAPTSIAGYIKQIYTFGLGFGALLALGLIVFGAIQWTLSEVVTEKGKAKETIMAAVWGLVLLLLAVLILQFINPELPELHELYTPDLPPAAALTPPPPPDTSALFPAKPTNVTAKVMGGGNVEITFDAPKDSTGITEYWASYDGSFVGKVSANAGVGGTYTFKGTSGVYPPQGSEMEITALKNGKLDPATKVIVVVQGFGE